MAARRPYRLVHRWDDGTEIQGTVTRTDRATLILDLERALVSAAAQRRPFSWRIEWRGRTGIVTLESGRVNHASDGRALVVNCGQLCHYTKVEGADADVIVDMYDSARAATARAHAHSKGA